MIYTYDESYLPDVQKNLGFFFQFMLWNMQYTAAETQRIFLRSIIPSQIEIGNPDFLCGKSGYELAMIALSDINLTQKIAEATAESFYPQAEYWSGYVLAYCQWKSNLTFSDILQNCPLEQILSSYNLLHEADITKAEQIILNTRQTK